MNEPFSFGAPERRRAMQFGYGTKPSFWQGVQSNAHLVIAAIGTAALLGVAGVALWLAFPAKDRQAIASTVQTVPAIPVKTTKVAPATANAAVSVAAAPQAARKGDAVSPATAVREAVIPALAANDPRWTDPGAVSAPAQPKTEPRPSGEAASQPAEQTARSAAAAFAEAAAGNNASTVLAQVAAPAPSDGQPAVDNKPADKEDGAQTAAIPEPKPQVPAAQPAESQIKPRPEKASAAANGRILRPVTMRTGPKKGAGAITTVPAKASVQVMSCNKWCEVIYNGKRGWVYKSYVKTGG